MAPTCTDFLFCTFAKAPIPIDMCPSPVYAVCVPSLVALMLFSSLIYARLRSMSIQLTIVIRTHRLFKILHIPR